MPKADNHSPSVNQLDKNWRHIKGEKASSEPQTSGPKPKQEHWSTKAMKIWLGTRGNPLGY